VVLIRLMPSTRLALRRLLPGASKAWLRSSILRTAELAAGESLGSLVVFARIIDRHVGDLTDAEMLALGDAIGDDLSVTGQAFDDMAEAVLKSFEVGGGA
jgi:hypothetical protein